MNKKIKINEGMIRKGGLNPYPRTTRPNPPKPQRPEHGETIQPTKQPETKEYEGCRTGETIDDSNFITIRKFDDKIKNKLSQ